VPVNRFKGGGESENLQERRIKPRILPNNNRGEQKNNREIRGLDAGLDGCAIRAAALRFLTLLKLHRFSFCRERHCCDNKKPGAVSAQASCTTLDDNGLYMNHVTIVYLLKVAKN
jgi:hypothetical protein